MAGTLLPPRTADTRFYNQRVVLNLPGSVYHRKAGRVVKSYFLRHVVVFDDLAHPGDARGLLFPAHELEICTLQEQEPPPMTDTIDDAVKLTLPEAAALARKAGEDAARLRKEARDAEAAHMTTERQHTLVPCATCGTGDQPKYMVSVGDDWLCTRCAESQIHTLRTRLSNYERKALVDTLGSEEEADRYLAFINQPSPEPPRPRRKEQP